jgi:hypothetical protein
MYIYGELLPDAVALIEPVLSPLQAMLFSLMEITGTGSTFTVALSEHV